MYAEDFFIQRRIFYTSWMKSYTLPFIGTQVPTAWDGLRCNRGAANFNYVITALWVFYKAEAVHASLQGSCFAI